jgi:hypothetical protein
LSKKRKSSEAGGIEMQNEDWLDEVNQVIVRKKAKLSHDNISDEPQAGSTDLCGGDRNLPLHENVNEEDSNNETRAIDQPSGLADLQVPPLGNDMADMDSTATMRDDDEVEAETNSDCGGSGTTEEIDDGNQTDAAEDVIGINEDFTAGQGCFGAESGDEEQGHSEDEGWTDED